MARGSPDPSPTHPLGNDIEEYRVFDANSDGVLDNVFLTNHDNDLTTAEVAARDPEFMAMENSGGLPTSFRTVTGVLSERIITNPRAGAVTMSIPEDAVITITSLRDSNNPITLPTPLAAESNAPPSPFQGTCVGSPGNLGTPHQERRISKPAPA